MNLEHTYETNVEWRGNRGTGTSDYRSYGRENLVTADGKPAVVGSADPTFHGNADRWNPEELLLAALSQCHLLSYLHVATTRGVVVTAYADRATGIMRQTSDGGGHFTSVTLHPVVTIAGGADPAGAIALAESLHGEAGEKCFIAASVNFPVHHEPTIVTV